MNLSVNQDNLYLFIPSKISWMVEMFCEDNDVDVLDAVRSVYASDTYRRLENEGSKLWHFGPVALYQDLIDGE